MSKKFILIVLVLLIGFFVIKNMTKSQSKVNPPVYSQTVETSVASSDDSVKVPADEVPKTEEVILNNVKQNESIQDDLNPVYDPPDHSLILVR